MKLGAFQFVAEKPIQLFEVKPEGVCIHDWMTDEEDIRFRECIFCGIVEYQGKDGKGGRTRKSPAET